MKVLQLFFAFVGVLAFLVALLACMDREQARQDYLKGEKAQDCIFKMNCDYYNRQLGNNYFKG